MQRWWCKSWVFVKPWEAKMVNCEWKPTAGMGQVGTFTGLDPSSSSWEQLFTSPGPRSSRLQGSVRVSARSGMSPKLPCILSQPWKFLGILETKRHQEGSDPDRHRAIRVFNKQRPVCATLTFAHLWYLFCRWPLQDLVDLIETLTKQTELTSSHIILRHSYPSSSKNLGEMDT